MSSGKAISFAGALGAIAAIAYLIAGLRKMTNWLRKGSDTLERSLLEILKITSDELPDQS